MQRGVRPACGSSCIRGWPGSILTAADPAAHGGWGGGGFRCGPAVSESAGQLGARAAHLVADQRAPGLLPSLVGPGEPLHGDTVYLAAVGPAMTRLAGEVADGLLVHGFTTERYLRERTLPALEEGLAASGRSRSRWSHARARRRP